MRVRRRSFYVENLPDYAEPGVDANVNRVEDPDNGNLFSSQLERSNLHAPAIDVDLPCRLIPSSTPDHYHLYIDFPMTWRQYKRILKALAKAGVIEPMFYEMARKRKATFLRKPGVRKRRLARKEPKEAA